MTMLNFLVFLMFCMCGSGLYSGRLVDAGVACGVRLGRGVFDSWGWVLSFIGGLSCASSFFSISRDTLTSCSSRTVLVRRQLGKR